MEVRLSGRRLGTFSVKEQPPSSGVYEVKAQVDGKGSQEVQIAFTNDFWDPKNRNPELRDRNLYVESLEIVPPSEPSTGPPPVVDAVCDLPRPQHRGALRGRARATAVRRRLLPAEPAAHAAGALRPGRAGRRAGQVQWFFVL